MQDVEGKKFCLQSAALYHPLGTFVRMRLAEVHDLVETVGRVDPACRDREVLSAVVAASARLRSWLDGRDVAIASQVEQVVSYPEKVLADAARTSLRDAERTVMRAQTSRRLPQLGEALADGVVSGAHVDAATRALGQLEPHQRVGLLDRTEWLVGVARRSTPDEFRLALDGEVRRIQADDGMTRLERQRRASRVRTWVDHRDGMWCLSGRFDPETGLRLHGRLMAALEAHFADQVPEGCPSDPFDKQDFLRARALVKLLEGDGTIRAGRPEIVIVVDTTAPDVPVVDWGIPVEIPWSVLADLAGTQADVHTVVIRNGVVLHAPGQLDLGRASRVASRAQRRALRGLYATCAIPGCAVKYDNCKLHHLIWWENGGTTDLHNMLPLCEKHHHCVHDRGWTLTLGPRRELTVQTPDGHVMSTGPPRRQAA
jgi:hypothetical protein